MGIFSHLSVHIKGKETGVALIFKHSNKEHSYLLTGVPAMSLSAAASGFVVFLLVVQVVQSQNDMRVTYSPTKICALKGTTVELSMYLSTRNSPSTVDKSFWFTKEQDNECVDLTTDSQYADRVMHKCIGTRCTLRITNLRKSDSAVYKFRLISNQPNGRYTDEPGVFLHVTDPDPKVQKMTSKMKCHSSCTLPYQYSYVWYKNGQEMPKVSYSDYSGPFVSGDSYTCALKGFKDFPSPPVCAISKTCNKVTYAVRAICASKGSSVGISCTYNSYGWIISKSWFSPGLSHHSGYHMQPEDLSRDPRYTGRLQVFDNGKGHTTLNISALNESDSAQYRFKFTTEISGWGSAVHGTNLTVTALQVQVTRIAAHQFYVEADLRCHSSCSEASRLPYGWFRNGEQIISQDKSSYNHFFHLEDEISRALKGHEGFPSPSVYAPKVTSVLLNPPGEIMENYSVTLTCSTDANPAANYTWYKKNGNSDFQPFSEELQLVYSSIQSSDSGEYYCAAENELGRRESGRIIINVKYAPKHPSVSVISLDEIMEGSSVTLTCKSDANPAATNTWYKEGNSLFEGKGGIYSFTSIRSKDSGIYFCKSENKYGQRNSSRLLIDVQYPPRLPTVSSSPSFEIMEGSMVNLTCSSDANPAAKYTWYKIDENTPIASGRIFTINDFGSEHSGSYFCEAHNKRGCHNSTLHLVVVSDSRTSVTVGSLTVIFLVIILLAIFLLTRRKMSSKETNQTGKRADNKGQLNMDLVYENASASAHGQPDEEQEDLYYASVGFSKNKEDPLYTNVVQAKLTRPTNKKEKDEDEEEDEDEDDVEYTMVNVKSANAISDF
ncbi:sialoadhesin isoform X3 [Labrus bergylta]|uniref:sialoadhesin isoform X3 n=1 Tax=Labrus bergylta TaxID=56723 RepID=UPI00331437F0